jgi:hypothetical protein
MPGSRGLPSHSYGGYPAGYSTGYPTHYPTGYPTRPQDYPPVMLPMHLTPPPPPPQEVPSVAPEADRSKARLEARLAVLTAQLERDERENTVRQELEGTVRQLKKQLEEARQESSREAERARLQGERDARQQIEEERHAELEKQMQLAKQRIEIESEVKIKLEAEHLAQTVREETQRKQLEELRREALECVLDRLDDAVTLSQEKLLGDTEMKKEPAATLTTKPDRELLLAEMKTSIASRLRQSLVLSEPEQNYDHISLRGRGSRSKLRSRSRSMSSSMSRSPRHQVECVSVPDASSSRSPNSSFHGIGPGDWTGDLPHVPDAPRNAYESEEENDDLTSHSGYDDYGDHDSVPGYRPRQYDSRRHYGRGTNGDYQDEEQRNFETLIHRVADAVMDRLRVPNWDGPMHTAPYDRQWGQYYPDPRRKPSKIGDYSDSFDERRPCGDVTDIHDDTPCHKEPKHISRPYKPHGLRGQPSGAVRNTSQPSPRTSLNPLPLSIAEEPNISEEDHARAQPSVFPKLLKNNNSVERDTESIPEYSAIQESTEPQANYKRFSDGGKDETSSIEETGRFGSQMKLWKEKMPES